MDLPGYEKHRGGIRPYAQYIGFWYTITPKRFVEILWLFLMITLVSSITFAILKFNINAIVSVFNQNYISRDVVYINLYIFLVSILG